jgi:hypothetical protein
VAFEKADESLVQTKKLDGFFRSALLGLKKKYKFF